MIRFAFLNCQERDFPDGSVVKNLPPNAGDLDCIPSKVGTQIPRATRQLSRCAATREAQTLHLLSPSALEPQLERGLVPHPTPSATKKVAMATYLHRFNLFLGTYDITYPTTLPRLPTWLSG